MANARPKASAHLAIGLAIGQGLFALALSWTASLSNLASSEQYRWRVELPMLFSIVPLLTAVGMVVHLLSSRHVERSCPWLGLAWMLLFLNMLALILFTQMMP